ncbi:MAG: hypothetical protein HFI78_00480 [Lachnospiraceae bacterium]|jgi:hypothetical protein|nr:hypothetical protein [Lachnospiraceae bacterium]
MNIKWKDGRKFALCLTHDVDRIKKQWYHYIYYGLKGDLINQKKSLFKRCKGIEPYNNFKDIMELEESLGVRSTFFFMDEKHKELDLNFWGRYKMDTPAVVEQIKELDRNGWEVGLHGSYYSFQDEEMLKSEKKLLESILMHDVVSVRQHHLNWNKNTWSYQKKCGLKYDSTVGSTKAVMRDGLQGPYYTKEGMLEFPISVMDKVFHRNFNETRSQTLLLLEETCKRGGIFVLDFHQCYLQEEYNPVLIFYKQFIKEAISMGAWIPTMKELGTFFEEDKNG